MNGDTNIYDLGNVDDLQLPGDTEPVKPPEAIRQAATPARPPRRIDFGDPPVMHRDPDWAAVPSLVVPGASHLLRGRFATAFCFASLTGFTLALAWAVHGTLDRLMPTLELLGLPGAAAVWVLGGLGVLLCALHLTGVYGGARPADHREGQTGLHPAVAGVASGIVPGLGQLLNGDRGRALVLLAGLWLVAGSWSLVSPWVTGILAARDLILPHWMAVVASPAVRWTLPAVLWTLAVYDAATRAGRGR